jgi:hypothetical protein
MGPLQATTQAAPPSHMPRGGSMPMVGAGSVSVVGEVNGAERQQQQQLITLGGWVVIQRCPCLYYLVRTLPRGWVVVPAVIESLPRVNHIKPFSAAKRRAHAKAGFNVL